MVGIEVSKKDVNFVFRDTSQNIIDISVTENQFKGYFFDDIFFLYFFLLLDQKLYQKEGIPLEYQRFFMKFILEDAINMHCPGKIILFLKIVELICKYIL